MKASMIGLLLISPFMILEWTNNPQLFPIVLFLFLWALTSLCVQMGFSLVVEMLQGSSRNRFGWVCLKPASLAVTTTVWFLVIQDQKPLLPGCSELRLNAAITYPHLNDALKIGRILNPGGLFFTMFTNPNWSPRCDRVQLTTPMETPL